jgi:hypothetical protein
MCDVMENADQIANGVTTVARRSARARRGRLLGALTALAVMVAACGDLAPPDRLGDQQQAALAETLDTAPTGWWWYAGITPAQLSSMVSSNHARIVSLQVEQASPLLFTVAMVSNTGSYARSWWYYAGVTAAQLSANLTANNARLVSLDAYDSGGTTLFAAVMISNTGADAKAWWWSSGVTTTQVSSLLQQNTARLVDLRSYVTGGVTRYAVVMISNTGADAMAWWWYVGIAGSQVGSLLAQNAAFLISIQPADPGGSTFNVIMEQDPGAQGWWFSGLSIAGLGNQLSQHGARLLDVKTYFVNGAREFAAVLVPDANLLANPGFETVGPSGSPTTVTTTVGGGAGNSAAASWTLFTNNPGTIRTEIATSLISPSGSNRTLHVITDADRNGVVQVFDPFNGGPADALAQIWVYVVRGTVFIGTGNGGGTFGDATSKTTGQWELLRAPNGVHPANEFIVYSTGGGAEYYLDDAVIQAAP